MSNVNQNEYFVECSTFFFVSGNYVLYNNWSYISQVDNLLNDYENYEALESFLKELLIFEDIISLLHIMKIKILFDRIYITKRQVFISRITTLNNLLKYL